MKAALAAAVYAYSFIVTDLDVSAPAQAAEAEHWYRHRSTIENIFRTPSWEQRCVTYPSSHPQVNTALTWAALLAASTAGWLHQLTAAVEPGGQLFGHDVRSGPA